MSSNRKYKEGTKQPEKERRCTGCLIHPHNQFLQHFYETNFDVNCNDMGNCNSTD